MSDRAFTNDDDSNYNDDDDLLQCSWCKIKAIDLEPCPDCQKQCFFCKSCRNPTTMQCPCHEDAIINPCVAVEICEFCGEHGLLRACSVCEAQHYVCSLCYNNETSACYIHDIYPIVAESTKTKSHILGSCEWCGDKTKDLCVHDACCMSNDKKHLLCSRCNDKMPENVCTLDVFES
jgi:hypothetical protein